MLSIMGATTGERRALASPEDVAEYLGVPVKTVYRWRYHHTGPKGIRVGRHVRYRWADVEKWLDEQQAAATSDS
jgi:excisionase family DNA binding protein